MPLGLLQADTILTAALPDSPFRMDLAGLSSRKIPAQRACLLCGCWDVSKPHAYQCYGQGNVMRGQPDNVALSCGIYDQVSTNDPLSHLFFPGSFDPPQRGPTGGCLQTPAFSLLFCRATHLSRYIFSTPDWHCPGSVLRMECCFRGSPGGLAVVVLVAAVICGRECSRAEFAPAQLLLQLSMGYAIML